MGRIGIFIDDKEVVKRYVGDKLVWEKAKVIYKTVVAMNYWNPSINRELHFENKKHPYGPFQPRDVLYFTVNGHRIDGTEIQTIYNWTSTNPNVKIVVRLNKPFADLGINTPKLQRAELIFYGK